MAFRISSGLQQVQEARRQTLGDDYSSVSLIEQQESPETIFTKQGDYALRSSLYAGSADLKSQRVFSRILSPNGSSSSSLQDLQEKRDRVQELREALSSAGVEGIRRRFSALPSDLQNSLRSAVWLKDWLNNKNSDRLGSPLYGKDEIDDNVLVLREAADKVVYLRGENLVEQLLYYLEDQLGVERQRENVRIVEKVAALMGRSKGDVLAKIESLPLQLQWKIHQEVQTASGADHLGFEWGKRKLYDDPSVLVRLKHPQSPGESLLQFHMRTQKELLDCCLLAAEVNEFEKIAVLYPLASDAGQKEELKKWLAPRVREWVCSLEAAGVQGAPSEWQTGSHPKLYQTRGAQYQDGITTFRVHAPQAKRVSVILTVLGREEHRLEMRKDEEGTWEAETPHAQPGKTYLYRVEDCNGKTMLRTDPFSYSTANVRQAGQIQSVVVDPASYQWNDGAWLEQRAKTDPLQVPLSIYEIQMKSWKSGYSKPLNFREMAPELIAYCKKMGFTHVECFGLLDHYFREARGYQVANFFAPYRDCGDSDDFKYLVDQLHQNGIGVIIDWIPTHFQHYHQSFTYSVSMHEFDGTDMFAAEASPWGTLYLDYEKEETRRLMFASALYFLDQLHIDGIRFDAISQMVHRNSKDFPAGISFLKELNDTIHSCYPGVMAIAEETEGFPNVTKPTKDGGLGFDMKWNIGWSHDSRNLLRTPYQERPQHWQQKVVNFLNSVQHGEKTILTHSHDDTDGGEHSNGKVLMQCVSHVKNEEEKFANLRNFFSWQALAPSWGHMLHMGDEVVQSDSWYQRFRRNISSVDWSAEQSPQHRGVQKCVGDLNALYLSRPQFWEKGERGFKLISEHGPNAVVAYHRGTKDNKRVAVVHNFSNTGYASYDVPLPASGDEAVKRIQQASEIFNSDDPKYGGSGKFENRQIEVVRNQGNALTHLRMALPPLSTVVLEEQLS